MCSRRLMRRFVLWGRSSADSAATQGIEWLAAFLPDCAVDPWRYGRRDADHRYLLA